MEAVSWRIIYNYLLEGQGPGFLAAETEPILVISVTPKNAERPFPRTRTPVQERKKFIEEWL